MAQPPRSLPRSQPMAAHDQPADPLLTPDANPRDATGEPVRAPVGNSARTLILAGLLVAAGIAIWWWRRPSDAVERLGGREWIIVDVDGRPATNAAGLASTFVLDGTHEVRAPKDCNTATGRWSIASSELSIEWDTVSDVACPDWPATFEPISGRLHLGDGVLAIDGADSSIRAIAPADFPAASADDLSGTWSTGGSAVRFGTRGLLVVGQCTGSWSQDDASITLAFDDAERERCELASIWASAGPIVATRFERMLFLRRDVASFPLDREVVRLDLVDDGSPLEGG